MISDTDRLDAFLTFIGIELFEWQKTYIHELIDGKRPITFLTPKRRTKMSESDYYWEKAEFQDQWSHRQHVENYKKGYRSSIFFDEQYAKEAEEELKGEQHEDLG